MAIDKSHLKSLLVTDPSNSLWDNLYGAWFFDDGEGPNITDYGPNEYNLSSGTTGSGTVTWNEDSMTLNVIDTVSLGGSGIVDLTPTAFDFSNGYTQYAISRRVKPSTGIDGYSTSAFGYPVWFGTPLYDGGAHPSIGTLIGYSSIKKAGGGHVTFSPEDEVEKFYYFYRGNAEGTSTDVIYGNGSSEESKSGTTYDTEIYMADESGRKNVVDGVVSFVYLDDNSSVSELEIELFALLSWERVLTDEEIDIIIGRTYNPTPTVVRKMEEYNNRILGGRQNVH